MKMLYLTVEIPLEKGGTPTEIASDVQVAVAPFNGTVTRVEAFEPREDVNPVAEMAKVLKQLGLGKREKWEKPDEEPDSDAG